MIRSLLLLAVLILATLLLWPQTQALERSRTALVMGTLVEIRVLGQDEERLDQALNAAFGRMRQLEERFSPHIETSDITRINRSEQPVAVDAELTMVLQRSLDFWSVSRGSFHIGLGRLKQLWHIEDKERTRVPTKEEIAAVVPAVVEPPVQLKDGMLIRPQGVQLDLGGIAKGYAVDQALVALRRAGVTMASVNAGGDIAVLGGHNQRSWRIGIQHPRKEQQLLARLDLRDQAVVTSGDYERYFIFQGQRYHHIFDPRTGYPARGCQSVTVVAPNAMDADALATAAFVLGPERGLQLLRQTPRVEGLIVAANGEISLTPGLKEKIHWPSSAP